MEGKKHSIERRQAEHKDVAQTAIDKTNIKHLNLVSLDFIFHLTMGDLSFMQDAIISQHLYQINNIKRCEKFVSSQSYFLFLVFS